MSTFHDAIARRLGVIDQTGKQETLFTNQRIAARLQAQMQQAQAQAQAAAKEAASVKMPSRPTYSPQQTSGGGGKYSATPGKWKPGTLQALIAFGRQAESLGYRVAENPHFGTGRVGTHSKNSRHYSGRAVDINWAAGTSKKEQDMLRLLIPLSQQYGLRNIFMQPGHYGHAHFDF